ncbi:MAG: 5'-methylthioadenosine/S-adenosylhomocysteine nucleosidase [Pseudomonadota bacterium]|nr:5'-methylthioadenosine/S-adenosylhomocysteine nucleosidase [Pseudomonadota bacterium]
MVTSIKAEQRPIVIQGAMPVESERMAARLQHVRTETYGGWKFWIGTLDGYPVVISKTLMGMTNAAAATAIAIEKYQPIAIINQGTSGGHDPKLKVYDIVLGQHSANIGAFKTEVQPLGKGSNPLTWTPMDVIANESSLDHNPAAMTMRKFPADPTLLSIAKTVQYQKGKLVEGTIGSSDVWNSELDRIQQLHTKYGTSTEEMEAASVAQVAALYQVPYLSVRILSNNITNDGQYDESTADACQDYVLDVAKAYIATLTS